jgi:hypothetical protein
VISEPATPGFAPIVTGAASTAVVYVRGSTYMLLGAKLLSNNFFENGAAGGFEYSRYHDDSIDS